MGGTNASAHCVTGAIPPTTAGTHARPPRAWRVVAAQQTATQARTVIVEPIDARRLSSARAATPVAGLWAAVANVEVRRHAAFGAGAVCLEAPGGRWGPRPASEQHDAFD